MCQLDQLHREADRRLVPIADAVARVGSCVDGDGNLSNLQWVDVVALLDLARNGQWQLPDDIPAPVEVIPATPRARGTAVLEGLAADGIIRIVDVPDAGLNIHRHLEQPTLALMELTARLVDVGVAIRLVAVECPPDIAGQVDRALVRLAESVERIEDAAVGEVTPRTLAALDILQDRTS